MSNYIILLAPLFFLSWRRCFVFSTRSEMVLVSWAKAHPPSCELARRHRPMGVDQVGVFMCTAIEEAASLSLW